MYGAFAWLTNAVPPEPEGAPPASPRRHAGVLRDLADRSRPRSPTDGVVFACAYLVVIVGTHRSLHAVRRSWTVAGVLELRARLNLVAGGA